MSTPPLSQRIRELEADLGLVLFERSSRSVKLTPAGERLLGDARAALAAFDRFEQAAAQLTAVATDLSLGYCHGSEGGAMRALRRFRDERPDVLVHPASMTSLNMVESIASGRLSVAILRGPIDVVDRVASVPLVRVPVDHVAVPLGHRLAGAAVVTAGDLEHEPVLVVDRADARTDVAIRPLQPIGMWDEFRVAWRAGDTRPATAACVRVVLETCGSERSG
jgi:DNA-binding transcriptional LysR family regulator